MDGSVTTQRTRSPPIRPARPEEGVDNASYGRTSAEYFTSVMAAAQQAPAQPQADGEGSTDTTPKPRKRKSARYSIGNGTGPDGAERKGSIRNAVRRLFGRKSKGDIPEVPALPRTEASRHGYHKSVSWLDMSQTRSRTSTDPCTGSRPSQATTDVSHASLRRDPPAYHLCASGFSARRPSLGSLPVPAPVPLPEQQPSTPITQQDPRVSQERQPETFGPGQPLLHA
jgi:hypothetical protein